VVFKGLLSVHYEALYGKSVVMGGSKIAHKARGYETRSIACWGFFTRSGVMGRQIMEYNSFADSQ